MFGEKLQQLFISNEKLKFKTPVGTAGPTKVHW